MNKRRIDELQKKYGTGRYKKKKEEEKIRIEEAAYKLKRGNKKNKKNLKQKLKSPYMRLYIPIFFLSFTILLILLFNTVKIDSYISKLIIDNKNISIKNPIYIKKEGAIVSNVKEIENADIYISIDDLKNTLDNNLVYNKKEGEIILTSQTSLIYLNLKKGEININGVKSNITNLYFEEGLITYIKINEIINPLGYNKSISKEFNILLDSASKGLKTLKLKEETFLKEKPGVLSRKIKKLKTEDTYIVVEEFPRNIKIRTNDGIYGYIQKSKVENIVTIRKEDESLKREEKDEKENINYIFNYSNPGANPDYINKKKDEKNIVIADMFNIEFNDKGFFIKENFDLKSESYKKYLNKITVEENMGMLSKIHINKVAIERLEKFEYRLDLILKIKNILVENNIENIFITFEYIKDPAVVSRFLIELKPVLKTNNLKNYTVENIDVLKADILKDVVDCYIDIK